MGLEEEASSSRSVASDPELLLLQLHLDLIWRSPRRKSSISRQRKERTDMLANASLDDGRYQLESKPSMTRQPKLFYFVSLQNLCQTGKVFTTTVTRNCCDFRSRRRPGVFPISTPPPSSPLDGMLGHPRATSNVFSC